MNKEYFIRAPQFLNLVYSTFFKGSKPGHVQGQRGKVLRSFIAITLLVVLFGYGCGSEDAGVCDPGATQLCFCDASTQVVQTCREDGTGWQACPCGPELSDTTESVDQVASSDQVSISDPGGPVCIPNNVKPCTCDSGQGGTTKCLPNGSGWGACECAPATNDSGNTSDMGSSTLCPPGAIQDCSCGPNQPGTQVCNAAGSLWSACECVPSDTTSSPDTGPVDPNGLCNDRTKVIWLLSQNNNGLIRFDPQTLNLQMIGNLGCPGGLFNSPFSMAVDRYANAWVEYQGGLGTSGSLYKVSTVDGSCQATGYSSGQGGLDLFGMAFVADGPQAQTDTLFVAGGTVIQIAGNTAYLKLASIDTSVANLPLTTHGTLSLPSLPELTGTGSGELYGFYPNTTPATLQQIDKVTGASLADYSIGGLNLSASGGYAYAFAFWGGDFYIFLKSANDATSKIWRYNPANPNAELLMDDIGHVIVGAGVSTCAPTTSEDL